MVGMALHGSESSSDAGIALPVALRNDLALDREFISLINRIENLDTTMKKRFDYNIVSGEGRVFFNIVKNNGSMLKLIANNPNFSLRTAFNSIKKLESVDLLQKTIQTDDMRRVFVALDMDRIINLIDGDA
jgi:predicted transcriptional regulator